MAVLWSSAMSTLPLTTMPMLASSRVVHTIFIIQTTTLSTVVLVISLKGAARLENRFVRRLSQFQRTASHFAKPSPSSASDILPGPCPTTLALKERSDALESAGEDRNG